MVLPPAADVVDALEVVVEEAGLDDVLVVVEALEVVADVVAVVVVGALLLEPGRHCE